MSLSLDGSGSAYLTRAVLPATMSYPFWVGIWCRVVRDFAGAATDYNTVRALWASERADESHGTSAAIWKTCAFMQATQASTTANAQSAQAVIPDPYWEHILCEFRSATDRRVYINGVQEGSSATSLTPDLSTGSPVTRVGLRSNGNFPFSGLLADMTVGTGTLNSADRTLLATPGASPTSITGGVLTNWYPLLSNGNDSVGGANFSNGGTPTYDAESPSTRGTPTPADAIQYWFKRSTLRTETPTVLTGQTSPISAMTNLASCEFLDVSFTGSAGAWNTRVYHLIPTTSLDHVVLFYDGHGLSSGWSASGFESAARAMVAAGYAVAIVQMPGFSPVDPIYNTISVHDGSWASFSSSVNPVEQHLAPLTIALNNLAPRYTKRSIVGFSGGAWAAAHYPAVDPRINHAAVANRGSIANRRRRGIADFEQNPKVTGWLQNDFYRLAARNCRLWLVHLPTDLAIVAQNDTNHNGAYLDAAGYRTAFIAPITAEFVSGGDLQMIESLGTANTHILDAWERDNAILPALSTSFTRPTFDVSISPTTVAAGATQVLTLTGVATLWDSLTTFTVSAGASKVSQNVTGPTSATVTVTAGGSAATVSVSDGVSSDTFDVSAPAAYDNLFDPAIFDGPELFDTGEAPSGGGGGGGGGGSSSISSTGTGHLFDPAIFDGPELFDTTGHGGGVVGGWLDRSFWDDQDYHHKKARKRAEQEAAEQLDELPEDVQPAAVEAAVSIADGTPARKAVRSLKASLQAAEVDWSPVYAAVVRDVAEQIARQRQEQIARDDEDVLLLMH